MEKTKSISYQTCARYNIHMNELNHWVKLQRAPVVFISCTSKLAT